MLSEFLRQDRFERYYVCDIRPLEGTYPDSVRFVELDVRKPIDFDPGVVDKGRSWVFNLAAIHREPGHEYHEYFDTNIPGSEHVNAFAERTGIENILFTSSIAPYGRSLEPRTERSPLYPETAYGISKALAEKIHQRWLAASPSRRLIIVRPSVIFGPRDPGNVYRMVKALKKGSFVLPDGGRIVKAYGYVYGLVESMMFTMAKTERLIIYNYAENPLLTLREMTAVVKDKFGYTRPVISLPTWILAVLARVLQGVSALTGKKSDIHPTRVRKAGFPTHIVPSYLIEAGFPFRYEFRQALDHWESVSPEDF